MAANLVLPGLGAQVQATAFSDQSMPSVHGGSCPPSHTVNQRPTKPGRVSLKGSACNGSGVVLALVVLCYCLQPLTAAAQIATSIGWIPPSLTYQVDGDNQEYWMVYHGGAALNSTFITRECPTGEFISSWQLSSGIAPQSFYDATDVRAVLGLAANCSNGSTLGLVGANDTNIEVTFESANVTVVSDAGFSRLEVRNTSVLSAMFGYGSSAGDAFVDVCPGSMKVAGFRAVTDGNLIYGIQMKCACTNCVCKCANFWSVTGDQVGDVVGHNGTCAPPSGGRPLPWCYIYGTNCRNTPFMDVSGGWGFCAAEGSPYIEDSGKTQQGCVCQQSYRIEYPNAPNVLITGGNCGASPTAEKNGLWCYVNEETCVKGSPFHDAKGAWDYCSQLRNAYFPIELLSLRQLNLIQVALQIYYSNETIGPSVMLDDFGWREAWDRIQEAAGTFDNPNVTTYIYNYTFIYDIFKDFWRFSYDETTTPPVMLLGISANDNRTLLDTAKYMSTPEFEYKVFNLLKDEVDPDIQGMRITSLYLPALPPNQNATNSSSAGAAPGAVPSNTGGLSTGGIVGIIVGVVAAVAAAALVGYLLIWRRKRHREQKTRSVDKEPGALGTVFVRHLRQSEESERPSRLSGPGTSSSGTSSLTGTAATAALGAGSLWASDTAHEFPPFSMYASNAFDFKPEEIQILKRSDGSDWLLGAGAAGKVYKAAWNDAQPVAVKVLYSQDPDQQVEFIKEINLLKACRHTNIVLFLGACLVDGKLWAVTEFMPGGNLWTAVYQKKVSWHRRGRKIAIDVARGLAFLHSRRIVHLDIKSPNILLASDGTAKIADVGLAQVIQTRTQTNAADYVGTFAWSAPELLLGGKCTELADIYSYGVVLWEICTNERPERGRLRDIIVPHECSEEVAGLVHQCLLSNPDDRPTATQIIKYLRAIIVPSSINESGGIEPPPISSGTGAYSAGDPMPASTGTQLVELSPQ